MSRFTVPVILCFTLCACTNEIQVDDPLPPGEALIFYDDAVARATTSDTGAITAELVTKDEMHDQLATLEVTDGDVSWQTSDGISRTVDPAGTPPATADEAAMYLYSLWASLEQDVAYEEAQCSRWLIECFRTGGYYCCKYGVTKPDRCPGDPIGTSNCCFAREPIYDCYPSGEEDAHCR